MQPKPGKVTFLTTFTLFVKFQYCYKNAKLFVPFVALWGRGGGDKYPENCFVFIATRGATTLILKFGEIWCNTFVIPQFHCNIRIRNLCPFIYVWTLFPLWPKSTGVSPHLLTLKKPPFSFYALILTYTGLLTRCKSTRAKSHMSLTVKRKKKSNTRPSYFISLSVDMSDQTFHYSFGVPALRVLLT